LDEAVERGLAYLARQQHADGSFDDEDDGPKYRLASTGLALLAFVASGHTPDTGRYGIAVRGAADLLVDAVPPDGYVGALDDSRMYGQAVITLALAEVCGVDTTPDKRRKELAALRKLVRVIVKAQEVAKPDVFAGGWRYTPDAADSDLPLTAWNVLALRAARDAGVGLPKETLPRAAAFITHCYLPDSRAFAYQPGGEPALGPTAAAVLCLALLDPPAGRDAPDGTAFLAQHPIDDRGNHPYHALYFSTLAAWQSGDEVWATVSSITLDRLIQSQSRDGGWPKEPAALEPGRRYRTAMALLTLSVPYRLLPVYQR
jgi:hypothetical protein